MSRARDQFALVILACVLVVYGIGLYQGLAFEELLVRVLVTGVVLTIVFTIAHSLLGQVFRDSAEARRKAASARKPHHGAEQHAPKPQPQAQTEPQSAPEPVAEAPAGAVAADGGAEQPQQ